MLPCSFAYFPFLYIFNIFVDILFFFWYILLKKYTKRGDGHVEFISLTVKLLYKPERGSNEKIYQYFFIISHVV